MKTEQSPCPITEMLLADYKNYLHHEERSANTISKYDRDLRAFFSYLIGCEIRKEDLVAWKEQIVKTYAPASVNSMLAAVNGFLEYMRFPQHKVKPLKIQREIFARPEKELTQAEYCRLVQAAQRLHNRRLALLLQTICSTGIRVSELCFVTVAALQTGRVTVSCKGKNRVVFLPKDLCHILRRYCQEEGIESGVIFRTKTGSPLDRSNIWRMMKTLCKSARVEPGKVFPHNLRHLFARTYYQLEKDLSRLADLLGHSSVNTTRLYTAESGKKHVRQLNRMGLILTNCSTT